MSETRLHLVSGTDYYRYFQRLDMLFTRLIVALLTTLDVCSHLIFFVLRKSSNDAINDADVEELRFPQSASAVYIQIVFVAC